MHCRAHHIAGLDIASMQGSTYHLAIGHHEDIAQSQIFLRLALVLTIMSAFLHKGDAAWQQGTYTTSYEKGISLPLCWQEVTD